MRIEKRTIITGMLMCCIFCILTLFVYSNRFVNAEVTPKWLGLMMCVGVVGVVWGLMFRRVYFPAKLIFVLQSGCFVFIFFRNYFNSGFNPSLLMYLGGLLVLFFLIQQVVKCCPTYYLFGMIIVFGIVLSIQGLLQYIGILSAGNMRFAVTGHFDNPAGFASALACIFPFCFLFFKEPTPYLKYGSIAAATLILITIVLSGSRAGMLAVAITTGVWLLLTKSNHKGWTKLFNSYQWKIITVVALFALPIALYFIKKDSADGRLLIWRSSTRMIADQPLLGHGQGALFSFFSYPFRYPFTWVISFMNIFGCL